MSNQDILLAFVTELRRIIRPVEDGLVSEQAFSQLIATYGWDLSTTSFNITNVKNIFNIQADLATVVQLITQISSGPLSDTPISKYIELAKTLQGTVAKIQGLGNLQPPSGLSNQVWSSFTEDLPHGLMADYLESYQPVAFALLILFGVIEEEAKDFGGATGRKNYIRRRIQWDYLITAITNPEKLMNELYAWNDSPKVFNYLLLQEKLNRALPILGLPTKIQNPRATLLSYYSTNHSLRSQVKELSLTIINGEDGSGNKVDVSLSILPIPPDSTTLTSAPNGFVISPLVSVTGNWPQAIFWPFTIELSGEFQSDDGVRLMLWPGKTATSLGAAGTIDASVAFIQEANLPMILLGTIYSHHLQLFGWKAGLYLNGPLASPEVSLKLALNQLQLIIQNSDADSFLQKVIGSDPQTFEFSGDLIWSSKTGLHFAASGGLELSFPINQTIGIAELYRLLVEIHLEGDCLTLVLAISGTAKLGPIAASVEKIGVKLALTPVKAGEPPGLFGNLDLALGFKPPDGLGLAVDAGPITGGGYLSIDTANGRYAGVLQLSIANTIAITAIGLLDTHLPGGVKGFSFLIIITAKFPPIQLGFGFALTGLGGLAGIHRSIVVKALQDAVRSKSIDNILFPENPVRDAPKLISDLQAIFPPTEGQFVFGPMAIITWGTPTVVEAELGIILELPNPIRLVILGQVNVTLPDKKVPAAVIDLHIDIVGIIDFTNRNLSIDASLHDSRLLAYNLYGDMAMRLSWGDPPNFALSVGGLHPQFQPPPDFPTLRRLTVALGLGENPRISLQAYLAVTSNTVQFGALAELYAEAAGFTVYGWIGFDVLFIFTPFSLTADFSAGVALRKGSTIIASVHLAATLTGPTPWHAWGEASVSILFLSVTVTFDATFGEEAQLVVEVADPWPALEAEIKKLGNWSATLPPAISQVVSLIAPAADEPGLALIDPLGGLTLRQKAVPFDRTLSKFGQGNLAQTQRFTLGGVTVGTQPATTGSPLLDYFAPGQFEEMTDAEKLSRSSFERMQAGTTIASDAVAFGTAKGANYSYKTVIIDAPDAKPRAVQPYNLKANHQTVALQRSAVAQSQLQTTGLDKFAPPPSEPALVTLDEEEYIIANTTTMVDQTEMILKYKLVPEWKPSMQHSVGDRILPSLTNGYIYRCVVAGTTGASEPGWPTAGSSVSDGTVTWQKFDDLALKTRGARNQLLAEYLVDHPEEMSTLEVMLTHEVLEAA